MKRLQIYRRSDQLFKDHRGYAFFPFQGDGSPLPRSIDLASLHVVITEPGDSRGNHQHPATGEWLHICGARSELRWEEDGAVRREVIAGDATVIYIPAGVGHVITNIDTVPMTLVAFREEQTQAPHTVGLDKKL